MKYTKTYHTIVKKKTDRYPSIGPMSCVDIYNLLSDSGSALCPSPLRHRWQTFGTSRVLHPSNGSVSDGVHIQNPGQRVILE